MVTCKICKGSFDNGELINGVFCRECIEEERLRQKRADDVTRIMKSPSVQMELNLEDK